MTDPVEIHVLHKKVRLLQPAQGFRTSLDTVMVAAACPVKPGQSVLDMGCGVGGVSFCILHRVPEARVTGVDIQQEYVDLAVRNIAINGPDRDVHFIRCDIRQFSVPDPARRFDHVVCNPPFLEAGHHVPSQDEGRARALGHGEDDMSLKEWVDAGFSLLQSGGSLTMIHRADALDRLLQVLGRRFGAVEVIPLWPKAGEPARRIIVRAIKDRKSPATLHAGIILHQADGSYTAEADKVLRGAQPIL